MKNICFYAGGILNRDIIGEILLIKDSDAQVGTPSCRRRRNFSGASGVASAYFAVKMAKRLPKHARVLCLVPDTGERYLSSDLFQG